MAQSTITVKIEGLEALGELVARLEQLIEQVGRIDRAVQKSSAKRGATSRKRN